MDNLFKLTQGRSYSLRIRLTSSADNSTAEAIYENFKILDQVYDIRKPIGAAAIC